MSKRRINAGEPFGSANNPRQKRVNIDTGLTIPSAPAPSTTAVPDRHDVVHAAAISVLAGKLAGNSGKFARLCLFCGGFEGPLPRRLNGLSPDFLPGRRKEF